MCGLAGVVSRDHGDLLGVRAMTDALAHRGPDGEGFEVWNEPGVAFGHRRLSIIDLSDRAKQPLSNEDRTVWSVYNGEIYNFRELRHRLTARGHVFRSDTDSEVLVHGYEEWGENMVRELRGMFAFAIWDTRDQTLFLARDRLGIKPLYYYQDDSRFLFASEIKGIKAHPAADLSVDRSAVWDYFTYLYIPAPKTAFARIRQIQPGEVAVLREGRLVHRRYWDVEFAPDRGGDDAVAIRRIGDKLQETVSAYTVADVPVGVFLSGGVDSSAVAACLADTGLAIDSFCLGFDSPSHDESMYARQVAERVGTRHHECRVDTAELTADPELILRLYDQPFGDSSALPTLRVSEFARRKVKVVLSGDGGDEVFAGYKWYGAWLGLRRFDRVPLAFRRLLFGRMMVPTLGRLSDLPKVHGLIVRGKLDLLGRDPVEQYGVMMGRIPGYVKRRLLPPAWVDEFREYDDYWLFRQHWRPELDPLARVQYLDLKTYLPEDILTKVDRASMSVSLEVRVPLLDHELLEEAAALPRHLRNGKRALRHAVAEMLPPDTLARPKKGFSVPLNARRRAPSPHRGLSGVGLWAWDVYQEWTRQSCA